MSRLPFFPALAALFAATCACASSSVAAPGAAPGAPIADPIPMPASTAPAVVPAAPTPPAGVPADVKAMLDAYEQVRARLAADDARGAATAARALATRAGAAADDVAASDRARVDQLATHARAIAGATELGPERRAFGEASRQLVALLGAHKQLARGRFVFECPMVKDQYPKWVQPTEDLDNPYMGPKMRACGAESTWD